jgi:hypothetical protein
MDFSYSFLAYRNSPRVSTIIGARLCRIRAQRLQRSMLFLFLGGGFVPSKEDCRKKLRKERWHRSTSRSTRRLGAGTTAKMKDGAEAVVVSSVVRR